MEIPSHRAKSYLVMDVSPANTRALLFDNDEGQYRLTGTGTAFTGGHLSDIRHGIQQAIHQLQNRTNRILTSTDGTPLVEEQAHSPINRQDAPSIAAVCSTGRLLKILLVAPVEKQAHENILRLLEAVPVGQLEIMSLNDGKALSDHLALFLRFRPDLVLVEGEPGNEGTHQPAGERSHGPGLTQLLQVILVGCRQIPVDERPEILVIGDASLHAEVEILLKEAVPVTGTASTCPPNQDESIEEAITRLNWMIGRLRASQHPELSDLPIPESEWQTASIALRRMIRLISMTDKSEKCALAVDINSEFITLTSGCGETSSSGIYPHWISSLGVRNKGPSFFTPGQRSKINKPDSLKAYEPRLAQTTEDCFDNLFRWSGMLLPENLIREYVYNKAIHPASLPYTSEELAIEKAIAKVAMQLAIKRFFKGGKSRKTVLTGLEKPVEPLIATGNFVDYIEDPGQAMLLLLDGLQPAGITTLILDNHGVLAALGAIAHENPILAVQVLGSSAFQHLGTVITPVGNARPGSPVLRIVMETEDGKKNTLDIAYGSITVLPLATNQPVQLHLYPLQRFDIGMGGAGRGGSLRITGGLVGLAVDARGRPLRLPEDPYRRHELFQRWDEEFNRR
jgi:hypothetical protein